MGMPLAKPAWTIEAFLAWENAHSDKHEFVDGEVFAMVGGRRIHGRAVANLVRRLANALDAGPCQVFAEAMKVRIEHDIVYPDVFVTCDPRDLRTEQVFEAPTVVVEVLLPSTEAYDRGRKFERYRRLPSLREFVLVDPEHRRVESFRRDAQGWRLVDAALDDAAPGAALDFPSLGVSVALADVFEGIEPVESEGVGEPSGEGRGADTSGSEGRSDDAGEAPAE